MIATAARLNARPELLRARRAQIVGIDEVDLPAPYVETGMVDEAYPAAAPPLDEAA